MNDELTLNQRCDNAAIEVVTAYRQFRNRLRDALLYKDVAQIILTAMGDDLAQLQQENQQLREAQKRMVPAHRCAGFRCTTMTTERFCTECLHDESPSYDANGANG